MPDLLGRGINNACFCLTIKFDDFGLATLTFFLSLMKNGTGFNFLGIQQQPVEWFVLDVSMTGKRFTMWLNSSVGVRIQTNLLE